MTGFSSQEGYKNAFSERGFTLVEMSIVVVILGIILTVAALSYVNISKGINLNAARKQIEAAMNRAKTAARQENVTYQLVFYTDAASGNPNSYEFLHNEVAGVDGSGNPIWAMTPTDGSVSGEEVNESGGHAYIKVANNVKLAGCAEIAGDAIVISFTPTGTTMSVSGSDSGGGSSSSTVTLNLLSGDRAGSVSINGMGTISVL